MEPETYFSRRVETELKAWKESKTRKPLILRGARQTGKTKLLKHFGATKYESCVYINLEDTPKAREIFEADLNIPRIISALEQVTGSKILPGKTLLILDEIQSIPRALTSLKYFYEDAKEYHVAVAGSLLGIALHEGTSFPVGKVDFLDLYPMSFSEFLSALNRPELSKLISSPIYKKELKVFHDDLIALLKQYLIIGGMPEAVLTFAETSDYSAVQQVHKNIINAYELDFSKHAPTAETPKIRSVYGAIPACLSKENKKFIFSAIRETARAREYEAALLWVEDTSLASKVVRVNAAKLPLAAYATANIFKLFLSDVGLLSTRMFVDPDAFLLSDKLFTEFKGALAEQFVFQELKTSGANVFYYSNDDSRGEIDFLLDLGSKILPVEVKSGSSLGSISFNNFREKWKLKESVKLSALPVELSGEVDNLPLYLAATLNEHYRTATPQTVIE